jgi:putative transposase
MKRYDNPEVIVIDRIKSYGAAMKVIGNARRQMTGRRLNNGAKIRIFRFDDGSEQCYASDNRDVYRNSFRYILLFTTNSTMNTISIHEPLSNSNELPHLLSGGNFVPPRFTYPTANSD